MATTPRKTAALAARREPSTWARRGLKLNLLGTCEAATVGRVNGSPRGSPRSSPRGSHFALNFVLAQTG